MAPPWVAAWDKRERELIGTFRIEEGYDPLGFPNIHRELVEFCEAKHRVADVGASIARQGRERAQVFEGLFTITLKYLVESAISGVYVQVQLSQVAQYAGLGFSVVTDAFQPAGCRTWWRGMLLRVDQVSKDWSNPDFHEYWRQKTGVDFRASFWRRIMERVHSAQGWERKF